MFEARFYEKVEDLKAQCHILTEQAGAWYYKRNLSPLGNTAEFAPLETVALKPNVALSSGADFMDLAGDGQPDVVVMEGPTPGLYEHDGAEGWQPFRPFASRLNRDLRDPNLKFVDLDGDGHADVLITEDDALVWHASLAEEGFGPAKRVAQALNEEKGARIVIADGTQSIYLADMSGDGLTDLVHRIPNSEICYWPNLGYCQFGAKVTMDFVDENGHSACFDNPMPVQEERGRKIVLYCRLQRGPKGYNTPRDEHDTTTKKKRTEIDRLNSKASAEVRPGCLVRSALGPKKSTG